MCHSWFFIVTIIFQIVQLQVARAKHNIDFLLTNGGAYQSCWGLDFFPETFPFLPVTGAEVSSGFLLLWDVFICLCVVRWILSAGSRRTENIFAPSSPGRFSSDPVLGHFTISRMFLVALLSWPKYPRVVLSLSARIWSAWHRLVFHKLLIERKPLATDIWQSHPIFGFVFQYYSCSLHQLQKLVKSVISLLGMANKKSRSWLKSGLRVSSNTIVPSITVICGGNFCHYTRHWAAL